MKRSLIFCLLFSLSLHWVNILAQNFKFNTLTKEGILDRQSILCITQDQQGRIIFGGQSQLYYFNSNQIDKLNITDYVQSNGLYIEHIAPYKDSLLFIGSRTGVIIYDSFRKELIKQEDKIWNAKVTVLNLKNINNRVFLLSKNGLYILQDNGKSYKLSRKLKVTDPSNLTHLADNRYILTTNTSLHEISIDGDNIRLVRSLKLPIPIQSITAYLDNDILWIGTREHGIFQYNLKTNSWKNINQSNSNLLSNNIRKIVKDKIGNVYIGTLRGLSIMKANESSFTNYRHEAIDKQSLSQNSIYDIFIDNQSNVWIGTYFGGLNYIRHNQYNITTYTPSYNSLSKLNSEIISRVAESNDYIWIGTEEEGIAKLNKQSKEITNLSQLTKSNLIKDIYIKDNQLYIAQIGEGLSIYDINQNTIQHHHVVKSNNKLHNNVNRVFVDHQDNIYMHTMDGLVMTNNSVSPSSQKILKENVYSIRDVHVNKKNDILLIINDSLYSKKSNDNTLKLHPLTADMTITSFHDDGKFLWLVTQQEIFKVTAENKLEKIFRFKTKSNANIRAHQNKLWTARNEGIFCYNLQHQTSNLITQLDGLLVKNLEDSRMHLATDGQLFVTSLNGLMSFYPDQIVFNNRIPNTILENIAGTNTHPIAFQRISEANYNTYALKLAYDENNFTITFASDNLTKPLKNKFRYKLEGFEDNWNETSIPEAKYAELSPGSYTLLIHSSNNDDLWSKTPLKINIKITPPFWFTWWAYLTYALVALGLLHLVIKFIVERELLLSAEKEHQKKINFFTQISHEIRTPLTLITAPIDEILDATKEDHETSNKVIRLKKNASKLLSIVNELLDFKKIDAGKEDINPIPVEAKSYLEDIFYLFSDLAISKQLKFFIDKIEENVILDIDTKHFDKVMYNLLSNAIKYTPQAGEVFLKAYTDKDGRFSIEVCDSGIGVEQDQEFKIFEEYYRDKNAQENIGTGIGLALTKKIVEQHKGSIQCITTTIHGKQYTNFKISLPPAKTKSVNHITEDKSTQKKEKTRIIDEKELLLIVEDNIELHDVIENIFKEKFTILKAYDGVQGLQYAQDYLPSLIISDVMMPNMDGIEMCELIKNNEKTAHVPIVMLTANTNEETQVKSLKYGSNIYLHKPFNPTILNLTVINLLNLTISKREQFNIDKKELTLSEVDLKFLNKLEKLIDDNLLNENFGVDYIAKDLGMSTPILYKKVKAITNLSVNNFVKTYRFRKAISMMKNGYNISEIAYAVGFSDRKYFSKEFKKIYGVNPSEYDHEA